MNEIKVGFALTGSFCTFKGVLAQIKNLVDRGYSVFPVMSEYAYKTDTRFGAASEITAEIESITGNKIIHTIDAAEPIGPKGMFDILVVAPCTGNTLGKIANGITDTCVTMAVKAHLRNRRPVILAVSTNDALGASARNIGTLLGSKNIFFVPMAQDDPEVKQASMVAKFENIEKAIEAALSGQQLQPVFL